MTKLTLEDVSYRVEDRVILDDLTAEFTGGDWLTIVGPSGTGKSTLLKIIAGLVTASAGIVRIDGHTDDEVGLTEYRQNVSYAVQAAQLFGRTVRDNLNLPFAVRRVAVDEPRQLEGLASVQLPTDYLDKPIVELSGGERQRVGVLRNLLFPPKVLLLDEITTGLDAETKQVIWAAIEEQHAKSQNIVLSVTHDSEEIDEAKMLLTLQDGKGAFSYE
jgi:putative ABC transport system ATP-binding protein